MHVDYILERDELPRACIEDCSAQGACDEAVSYWRHKLRFTVDRDNATACLVGYGAWSRETLIEYSDEQIAEKILWLACCDFRDSLRSRTCGAPIFVLE